jgi:drug/metabolite transporter (DMT)-like permease
MSDQMQPAPDKGRDRRGPGWAWVGGAVLIVIGVIFLLQQNFGLNMNWPWWALFIYLAAAANFANMWRYYKADGHFGKKATGALVGGLLLTDIASIFIFGGSSFDKWWPTILISIGAGIVIGGLLGSATKSPD